MIRRACALSLLLLLLGTTARAEETKPETIIENMSLKLIRGVTNVTTCVGELPKQTYLTVQEQGGFGYVLGPLKGIGMTLYRGVLGATETIFFMVPQPGFYDPMIQPDFVWKGWDEKK